MSKELINYNDKKTVADLKATVAKNTTDSEFQMFVEVCRGTGLNPFLKEIWCVKTSSQVQIMVGLNGYLKIANSHPDFDGMTTEFEKDEKGKLTACYVKVYRKSRTYASVGYAFLNEVAQNTPIWQKRPSQMLEKCAIANGIRKAFATELAGTYIPEEMLEESVLNVTPEIKKISAKDKKVVEEACKEFTESLKPVEVEIQMPQNDEKIEELKGQCREILKNISLLSANDGAKLKQFGKALFVDSKPELVDVVNYFDMCKGVLKTLHDQMKKEAIEHE